MIDEKKFAAELQQWKNRLGDSYDEELAAIILKAVIDKLNIQPKIDVPDKNVGDKTWIPVNERLPRKDERFAIWVSFNGPAKPYARKALWNFDKFTWPNGKEIPEVPVAWKPYYVPEPYREYSL